MISVSAVSAASAAAHTVSRAIAFGMRGSQVPALSQVPARSQVPALSLVILLALACFAPSPARAAVDLIGSWYVLIHYRDSSTANPDSDRWEDKVWKIEQKGSRLQWMEYPIVVFEHGEGRFGRVGRNERARLMHAWEPNEAQKLEIAAGPQVNSRGSKTKTLRGSAKAGYASSSSSRSTSAFTVGYEEAWSIEAPTTLPVFTRDDSLGTEAALAAGDEGVTSGRTRYSTLEVLEDGNRLVGTYFRDENKQGTFQLIRSGAPRGLETDGKTPNQKQSERFAEQIQAGVRDAAYSEFMRSVGADNLRALRSAIGEDGITAIWTKYERRLIGGDEKAFMEIGPALYDAYVAGLEKKIDAALADGDPSALLEADAMGLAAKELEFARDLRETLGEAEIAELRAKFSAGVKAGDEQAKRGLRDAIRAAYLAKKQAEFRERALVAEVETQKRLREAQQQIEAGAD